MNARRTLRMSAPTKRLLKKVNVEEPKRVKTENRRQLFLSLRSDSDWDAARSFPIQLFHSEMGIIDYVSEIVVGEIRNHVHKSILDTFLTRVDDAVQRNDLVEFQKALIDLAEDMEYEAFFDICVSELMGDGTLRSIVHDATG